MEASGAAGILVGVGWPALLSLPAVRIGAAVVATAATGVVATSAVVGESDPAASPAEVARLLVASANADLRATTISYPEWQRRVAQGRYPDVTVTKWWQALDKLERAEDVLAATIPPPPTTTATTTTAPTTTAPPTTTVPPTTSSSLWAPASAINTTIPAGTRVLTEKGQGPLAGLPGIGFNGGGWGVAIFDSRGKSWARKTVRNPDGWTLDNVPVPPNLKSYVDSMAAKGDAERHLVVIDGDRIFNVYGSKYDGTTWTCLALGVMRAPGVSHGFWNNSYVSGGVGGPWLGRASGLSSATGAVTKKELDAGDVPHALALGWPKASINTTGWVAPATSSDGSAPGTGARMGSRLQLDPALTDADFRAMGIADYFLPVARAMQRYGAYVSESTSWMTVYAESWNDGGPVSWPAGWHPAAAKLLPHLRIVEPPTGVVYDDRSVFAQPHK